MRKRNAIGGAKFPNLSHWHEIFILFVINLIKF